MRVLSILQPWAWLIANGFGAVRIGKKRTGRMLDGVEHNAYPMVRT